ncbi:hypothetical protein L6R53_13450 [Myxococcota bacterium]|nr:hypothetical protein [Myxococcota bacterium]
MPSKPVLADDRVGPFALVRELDRDPATDRDSRLWLAERVSGDRSPREAVVRRALDPDDRAAAARIAAEYEALRAVDDPRIPKVLGHFAGQAALAMTWAPGPTLADAAAAHRQGLLTLDAATVLDLAEDLAQALRQVHGRRGADGRPLVHGRLDARRVRLGPTGQLTLLGLGRTGGRVGLAEQAPERLAGAAPSARGDQWALGAMLVELLTGSPLYEEPGGPASASVRREGRVEPWVEPIAQVNPALGRMLARLLAVDPAARFEDEGELIRGLQALRRSLRGVADRGRLVERMAELGLVPAGLPTASAAPSPAWAVPDPADLGPLRSAGPALVMPAALAAPDAPIGPRLDQADPDEDEVTQPLDPSLSPLPEGTLPEGPLPEGPQLEGALPGDATPEPPPLEDTLPLPRRPLVAPATSRRLGLGEWAAIGAVALLVVAAIAALAARS